MKFVLVCAASVLMMVLAPPLAAAELKPWNGTPLPAFELKDLSGREHRLLDYRGKVVVVNFWATWCEPCRDEMPALEKLQKKFAGRPFVVLAVNFDEPEARIRKFMSVLPLTFPVLLDRERKLAKAWNVRLLPATYVVDPDGEVRFSVLGELDWTAPEIVERIASLLPAR